MYSRKIKTSIADELVLQELPVLIGLNYSSLFIGGR